MSITIELLAGLEQLSKTKKSDHEMLVTHPVDFTEVVDYVATKLLEKHGNVFTGPQSNLAPGIIALINDQDITVLPKDTRIKAGDKVTFLSMVHGG
ncbi:Ubiquitin related modifier protein [Giardia duodenalis]|uniref:Ubiquitin-related modifier 1 homolog n=1 Tax=Giardia intestinalis TaxID=5741 RepID=V6TLC7_GIAIN|nr:Ubiquitin related modifier protein [Giardia intestinalis]